MSSAVDSPRRVIGALTFCFENGDSAFGDPEVEFGARLAIMISMTEENAITLSRHQRIAEAFQRALIDLPHASPDIDFGHLYTPATDSDVAGGDFYDVFALDERARGGHDRRRVGARAWPRRPRPRSCAIRSAPR